MDKYTSFLENLYKELGPEHCAYWVGPNIVLTLSGERAYGDSVFWGDKNTTTLWQTELAYHLKILEKYIPTACAETSTRQNTAISKSQYYTNTEIVSRAGLVETLRKYTFFQLSHLNTISTFTSLQSVFEYLKKALEPALFQKFSSQNINHLLYGALLGYPEPAIIESITMWQEEESPQNTTHKSTELQAKITYANYYQCPQPIFSYPAHLRNDEEINNTIIRWNNALLVFYEGELHKKLASKPAFQRKIKELST
jgi:hypothetical protein